MVQTRYGFFRQFLALANSALSSFEVETVRSFERFHAAFHGAMGVPLDMTPSRRGAFAGFPQVRALKFERCVTESVGGRRRAACVK